MSARVATCLWFDNNGEEAARFYVSLLPGSSIGRIMRPQPGGPALMVEFDLCGVPYQVLNGGPHYQLNEAVSVSVVVDSQDEVDRLWTALTADGGSESRCGWLKDRFGLSWQIVPRRLLDMHNDPDREAAGRAMQAMLKMRRLIVADLEAAFAGRDA